MGVSMLVAQACYQTLPLRNITLFFYLSKFVLLTRRLRLGGLSQVISILYPYADHLEKQWAPLPCTVSGFRSRILNVSNSNSLVSILPIPHPVALPDGHGYTPLRNIMEHALMLKKFKPQETKDPKWQLIASCRKFKAFVVCFFFKSWYSTGTISPEPYTVTTVPRSATTSSEKLYALLMVCSCSNQASSPGVKSVDPGGAAPTILELPPDL
jgi:hypothetical protein